LEAAFGPTCAFCAHCLPSPQRRAHYADGELEYCSCRSCHLITVCACRRLALASTCSTSVRAAREAGCREPFLLKCTSSYPASPRSSNLATIPYMREVFGCEIGLSDHTLGLGAAVASITLGATVIEKHVTLRRADGGVDSQFSKQPEELSQLVTEATAAWEAVGTAVMGPANDEKASLIFRRSLYVCADLRAGDVLTRENLRAIRPGFGPPPKYLEALLGKCVVKAVRRGTPADWSIIW